MKIHKLDESIDFEDERDNEVRAGQTFVEGGTEYTWVKQHPYDIYLDFDHWTVWEAVSEDGEKAFFVVDPDIGFIDWGPCETVKEAAEFYQSKIDDYEEERVEEEDYVDLDLEDQFDRAIDEDVDEDRWYFGKEEWDKYGTTLYDKIVGRVISKRMADDNTHDGIRNVAKELGVEWPELLSYLEALCRKGLAKEIDDGHYRILYKTVTEEYAVQHNNGKWVSKDWVVGNFSRAAKFKTREEAEKFISDEGKDQKWNEKYKIVNLNEGLNEDASDGWDENKEQIEEFLNVFDELDQSVYEIRNAYRGAYTSQKTYKGLSEYLEDQIDRLSMTAEAIAEIEDEEKLDESVAKEFEISYTSDGTSSTTRVSAANMQDAEEKLRKANEGKNFSITSKKEITDKGPTSDDIIVKQ